MEKNEREKKEIWLGALDSQWEENTSISPSLNWEQLSPHVLKKNRRKRVWWWGMTLILVGMLMSVLYFNNSWDGNAELADKLDSASSLKNDSLSQNEQNALTSETGSADVVKKDNKFNRGNGISSTSSALEVNTMKQVSTRSVENEAGKSITRAKRKSNERDVEKRHEEKRKKNHDDVKVRKQEQAPRTVIESSVVESILDKDPLESGGRSEENSELSTDGLIDSKPLFPLAIHTNYQIKIPAPMKWRKPPQFSYQMGWETGRSIRIIKGNYDGDGVQSKSIGARRWFLPKRLLHASVNWHCTENFSLQLGCQWGGGDIQSRWVFRNLSVEPNTQELRMQSSDGDVVANDPSLIDQITNGNGGVYQLRLNYTYRMLTIPIGVRYRLTNQVVSPLLRLGWNWERIGRREMSIDVNENGVIRNIPLVITEQQPRRSMQQYGALGVSMRLHERFEFYMECIYYFPLSQMINANGYQVRSSGIGIQWGLQYRWH